MVVRICLPIIWTKTAPTSLPVPIKTHKKLMQMDECSHKLKGDFMLQAILFTRSTRTKMESKMTSSPQEYGEDYHKEKFPPLSWSTSTILWILVKLKMEVSNSNE